MVPSRRVTNPAKTPFLTTLSHLVGWLADRRIPRPLRAPIYRAYARATGADLDEIRLALPEYPSLSAFFVRHLKSDARPFLEACEALPSPVDGTVQSVDTIRAGMVLQAKGRPYSIQELCGATLDGLESEQGSGAAALEGGTAWTIYLSPRDYHRIHSPENTTLEDVRWMEGTRFSVAPKVLLERPNVLAGNERCALRLVTDHGPLILVLVGALNVGRMRVVGIEPGADGPPPGTRRFERGEELARFEMGSTIVLLAPPGGPRPLASLAPGDPVRMGQAIGERELR